jgi:branched-chain amino acid transport system permease protein
LSFASGKAFFVLASAILALSSAVVFAIRRGTTGRELAAMRGSELAAASIGTNLAKLKITVFAVAAALAGVGGALYGSLQGTVSPGDFNSLLSLVFMVVVVTTGVYTVEGAIEAGMAYVILYQLLDYLPSQWRNLFPILFGAGAVTYALHPEGILEWQKRRAVELLVATRKHAEAVG